MQPEQAPPFAYTVAAWILTGIALVLVLLLHLLPALLAGMLVFELVHLMAPAIHRRFPNQRATLVAVALLSGIVMALVSALLVALVVFFNSDAGSVSVLLAKMADIIETSRATMPGWFAGLIPDRPDDMSEAVAQWLRTHATTVRLAGAEAGRFLLYVVAGIVLGAMLALSGVSPVAHYRPLAGALIERARRLSRSFRRVVFAQVQISLLNTLFTGIYLALILPLFGVHLPLKKTLIAVTFITGLLPVVGNLLSNTAIVVVSLSYSVQAAIASLVFLVLIHKLEYLLNARIIGSRVESRTWEMLMAMLVMEAAFGFAGVIAAPIFYAYAKDELMARGAV
ncbi:MAG: AI-2E family transporter [Betaproteobacteria bacterium]